VQGGGRFQAVNRWRQYVSGGKRQGARVISSTSVL
jgi:hypothetical protein